MAQEKGLQVVSATVDGFIYAGDRTTIQAVSARTALDQAISIPCNTFVLAAGPWSGELARRIMPARAKAIEVTGERAHSIILKCRKDLTPHAIFCRLYTDGAMRDPEIYSRPNGIAYICGAADEEPLPATAADVATSSARERFEQVARLSHQYRHSCTAGLRRGRIITVGRS
jgi:glycine/D-amino acid oxidase-like deaminating enzyme